MELTLIEVFWIQICTQITKMIYFDNYYCSGNSSLFQIKLISLYIVERIFLPLALNHSVGSLSIRGYLCIFILSLAILTSQHWSQALAVLPVIINPMYIQQVRETIPSPSQNSVRVYKHITLLILYYVLSWQPFLWSSISLCKSLIFLILQFDSSSLHLAFRFSLFCYEVPTSIMSYIVQILYITLVWIVETLHLNLLPLI